MKLIVLAFFLAQDRKAFDEAAVKALNSVRDRIASSGCYAKFAEMAYFGLACLAQGSTPSEGDYAADVKRCLDYSLADQGDAGMANWHSALTLLFLAEVQKKQPSDEVKARMQALIQRLEESQEPTGGWCHHKGYAYNGRRGPIGDLGILTSLVIAALADARSCGSDVPRAVLDRALKYCGSHSDGDGLIYGTNNPLPDWGNSRAAMMVVGLHFLNDKNDLYSRGVRGLTSKVKGIDSAHSFRPIHFFNSAVGHYVVGQFGGFKAEWLAKILAMREKDGSIWFKTTGGSEYERNTLGTNTIGTAVLALILQLDKGNVFRPPGAAPKAPDARPGKSPFSQKK